MYGVIVVPLSTNIVANLAGDFFKESNHAAADYFLTSKNDSFGKSFIAAVDIHGKSHYEIPVPNRCHATAFDPIRKTRAVVFPKRPGYISYLIDFKNGVVLKEIKARKGRFFYGHGSYSKDGKYLVVTENDYVSKKGVVSVWDGESLDFLGEFDSFGVGPHELVFSEDGKQVIVANGGLYEDPEVGEGEKKGRVKQNVKEMKPSLTYIDFNSRKQIAKFQPENHYLSLRHLSLGNNGLIAVAIQNEGPKNIAAPLVAFHSGEDKLKEVFAPDVVQRKLNNFALSILMEPSSGITCVTCPKGNVVTFWDAKTAAFLSSMDIPDAGGVTLFDEIDGSKSFLISTGKGEVVRKKVSEVSDSNFVSEKVSNTHFDNHLSSAFQI